MLQVFSYQFDSLPILFSMIFCVWAFLIPNKNIFCTAVATFILAGCSLLTYQSAVSIIVVFAAIKLIMLVKNNAEFGKSIEFFFARVLAVGASCVIWYLSIYKTSKFNLTLYENILSIFNKIKYLNHTYYCWRIYTNFLWGILLFFFVLICVYLVILAIKTFIKINHRICAVVISLCPLIIWINGMYGFNILHSFNVDYRLLIHFCALMFAIIFLPFVLTRYHKLQILILVLSIFPIMSAYSIMYMYANALKYNYETNSTVALSLNEHFDTETLIVKNGVIKPSDRLANLRKNANV
jgi:hypothetical protein